ncbi:MAG: ABC transporter permease [Bacteroidota bacterium]
MFFKKKRNYETYSRPLSYYAWQRMKKDKLAMFGLVIIAFMVLLSVFGYAISPDSTPDADNQLLELGTREPGFTVKVLLTKKNQPPQHTTVFARLWEGAPSEYNKPEPLFDYRFEKNNIVYETYTGKTPNSGTIVKKNLADVVYALDDTRPFVNDSVGGRMEFYILGKNEKIVKTRTELIQEIESDNIQDKKYYLGTDKLGRDMLSRLILGARVSLSVGLVAVVISFVIGLFFGAVSGFFRGWVDDLIMWIINVVWSIPTLLLVIAITLALGKGLVQVFLAVGLTMWVDVARVVRGQALSLREKEFIEAGRALGYNNMRIILKHLLPNVMGPVIVISAANFANAILIEAGLSYLGIGAQPPTASWGAMISEHRQYIFTDSSYLAVVPGVAIMLIVLAFMFVGNGLRDALDSKTVEENQVMGY